MRDEARLHVDPTLDDGRRWRAARRGPPRRMRRCLLRAV